MADGDKNILWSPVKDMKVIEPTKDKSQRAPSSELDKNAFLQLLITQMKYQDPLNPMDDRDFLGQMAQFTALEQMQNLNATYAKTQAYSMIGKTVEATYLHPQSEEYVDIEGLVSAVTVKNGEVYLMVDGNEFPMSAVQTVADDYFTSLQLDAIYQNSYNSRAQGYVGKYIQALVLDEKGTAKEYVEGTVGYVKFNNGQAVLVVNGNKEILPEFVTATANSDGGDGGAPFLKGREINGHEITDVVIKGEKAELTLEGVTSPVSVARIDHLMDALGHVDKMIKHDTLTANAERTDEVVSVTIEGGIIYFKMRNNANLLSYADYKGLEKE